MVLRKAAAYIKREAEDIWELHGIYLHRSGAHLFSLWLISMIFFTFLSYFARALSLPLYVHDTPWASLIL